MHTSRAPALQTDHVFVRAPWMTRGHVQSGLESGTITATPMPATSSRFTHSCRERDSATESQAPSLPELRRPELNDRWHILPQYLPCRAAARQARPAPQSLLRAPRGRSSTGHHTAVQHDRTGHLVNETEKYQVLVISRGAARSLGHPQEGVFWPGGDRRMSPR